MKALIISIGLVVVATGVGFGETKGTTIEEIVEKPNLVQEVNLTTPEQEAIGEESSEYTLGADDVIEILVRRHPEFTGKYIINKDGKIQYRFVGDIEVAGLNKEELQKKLTRLLSEYVVEPEINITILEYKSKVFYVIGEVARPGKYYMMGNVIPVREAVVMAGLPTMAAAMRKCRLTRPSEEGKPTHTIVNIYEILYGGDLSNNIDMQPGDVLYVPATVMAKAMRVIAPVSAPISTAASTGRTVVAPIP